MEFHHELFSFEAWDGVAGVPSQEEILHALLACPEDHNKKILWPWSQLASWISNCDYIKTTLIPLYSISTASYHLKIPVADDNSQKNTHFPSLSN